MSCKFCDNRPYGCWLCFPKTLEQRAQYFEGLKLLIENLSDLEGELMIKQASSVVRIEYDRLRKLLI